MLHVRFTLNNSFHFSLPQNYPNITPILFNITSTLPNITPIFPQYYPNITPILPQHYPNVSRTLNQYQTNIKYYVHSSSCLAKLFAQHVCRDLISYFTYSIYQSVCRGLFEKHKSSASVSSGNEALVKQMI